MGIGSLNAGLLETKICRRPYLAVNDWIDIPDVKSAGKVWRAGRGYPVC